MLKLVFNLEMSKEQLPAAFRRLCVETATEPMKFGTSEPAAFRRLCVETEMITLITGVPGSQPPSGGCVLKQDFLKTLGMIGEPAAFRRLCVETQAYA